ncbi:MAG: hypothetical protein HY302_01000 [Opitutae bacterium]|nr:hypothetical protein [Opitutae bacterium]
MRPSVFFLLAFAGAAVLLRAEPPAHAPTGWERVNVAPMKTSIYVGSVTLSTQTFERHGSTLSTTYEAKVFPWFFWGETGRITITLADAELAHLAKGETAEFTGEAFNHKNKPRHVSGRAQPVDSTSGKMKIRIKVDDLELIFNGTYHFDETAK